MPIVVADRVLETSTTSGTGTLTLAGAASGFQAFVNGIGVGNQTYYTIYDPTSQAWEVGLGTLLTGTTLSRTTVFANSSGTTALLNLAANSKNVFCTAPASKYVDQYDIGTAPNQIPLNQYLGDLAYMDVVDTISGNPYYDTAISDVQPTLNLDFVNAKTLDSRITFARATNATFYNANSSAKAEENLVIRSQEFYTGSWGKSSTTVTPNATTAPDGTSTADSMLETATTNTHLVSQNLSATTANCVVSCFVKPNGRDWCLLVSGSGFSGYWFNLTGAGAVGTAASGTGTLSSPFITSVGSGWYRVGYTRPFKWKFDFKSRSLCRGRKF
jgi:hypothetical protein